MDLFFDLDGTLTDPAVGITRCLQHALRALGRHAPPAKQLRRFIGPPLRRTFAELLETSDPAVVEQAVAHYRERFSTIGLYENEVYPEVATTLATLGESGHRLWVVTSKPAVFAARIVQHFHLAGLFRGVHGSELSGENSDKADLVAHVLHVEQIDGAHAVMIGDRGADIAGGRANRTATVGVLWGYGLREELEQAHPDAIVASMAELAAYVTARCHG